MDAVRQALTASWIALWSIALLPLVSAQSPTDLETDLEAILEDSQVTGAGIVIIENGEPSAEVYWGLADRATGTAVSADTIFRAGSISKSVTSTIAMLLAEEGRIDLEAPVRDVAPEIVLNNPWADTEPVRIAHLLEHTAGLAGSSYREYSENMPDAKPANYVETIGSFDVRWQPGTLYSYSNAGHTVLARVLEVATGESFDDLAENHVFGPLQMPGASFLTYGENPDQVAKSYTLSGEPEPVWEMLIRPSGSLLTTPRELAKFVAFHAGAVEGIMSDEAIARMARSEMSEAARQGVGAGAYGFGSFSFAAGGQVFRGHWGQTEGFRANMGYLPGTGSGFVLMMNTVDEQAASAIRERIGSYFTEILGPAEPAKTTTPNKQQLQDAAGHYILATHHQPMRDWLFKALEQRRITTTETGLQVSNTGLLGGSSRLYRPAASGGYVAEGFPLATAAIANIDGRHYWIDNEAYVRVSGLEAIFRRLVLPAALLVSIVSIVHGVVWGIALILGRGPSGDGLWIRSSLLISGFGFILTSSLFATFGLFGNWDDLSKIGQPSLVSLSVALGSLVAVIGAFAALGFSVRRAMTSPGGLLFWAFPASLILTTFAILWISAGWFPLISWSW
ncbi:MAG: serine hydrolase domain-containing protein [Pseudomonadota bacterium]